MPKSYAHLIKTDINGACTRFLKKPSIFLDVYITIIYLSKTYFGVIQQFDAISKVHFH